LNFFSPNLPATALERYARRVMSRPILFLATVSLLGACQQIEPAPPPLHPHQPGTEATAEPVASMKVLPPEEHAQAHGPAAGAIVPRATVEQVEPGQEALAEAIISASKPSLAECRGNSGGGTLRLRIVGSRSSAKITVDSDTKVNDKVRHCVLEALSTLDVPDTLSRGSPSMAPSAGFTSIIAVNW